MRKLLVLFLVILFIVPMAQAKIKLIQATIDPAAASGGEKVTATVEFSGKVKNISKVMMIPREFAYDIEEPFSLQKAENGKNVWSLTTTVPYEAPTGAITLEIKALDSKGKEVVITDFKDQVHGKAGELKFEIKY